MNDNLFQVGLFYIAMTAVMRMAHEAGGHRQAAVHEERPGAQLPLAPSTVETCSTAGGELSPEKIEEIKRRELRRYREAQDKKWRNWAKAMSR